MILSWSFCSNITFCLSVNVGTADCSVIKSKDTAAEMFLKIGPIEADEDEIKGVAEIFMSSAENSGESERY